MFIEKKPISRSKLRLIFGKKYYSFKKHLSYHFTSKIFSNEIINKALPYKNYASSSEMIRHLKNVPLYLQYNKIVNLRIAAKNLNGIIIKPGETFSYWYLIGKPTYKKGYMDGLILNTDGSFGAGVGGGLCQLSNLIYWLSLHSELTVVERYRHSHDVFPDINRIRPFGTGATCIYNYRDLQIYNGTKDTYQFVIYLTEENLCGEIRCSKKSLYTYEIYEKEHSITPSLFKGYIRNNLIFRKVYNLDYEIVRDEYLTENHALMMYEPLLQNKGSTISI